MTRFLVIQQTFGMSRWHHIHTFTTIGHHGILRKKGVNNCLKDTLMEVILQEYTREDTIIHQAKKACNVNVNCMENCSECCKEYFYFSIFEYFILKNELENKKVAITPIIEKSKNMINTLKETCYAEYAKLHENKANLEYAALFNDKEHITEFLSCPLIDKHGKCMAYEKRPPICKHYGFSSAYGQCEPLKQQYGNYNVTSLTTSAQLTKLLDYITYNNQYKLIRPYPLFWFFAHDNEYLKMYQDFKTIKRAKFIKKYYNEL